MKQFIIVLSFLISSAAFAGSDNFLPQCSIKSQNPFFQPDITKPFYLARNIDNQTIQYCNEESLLKSQPWINANGKTQLPSDAKLLKFSILPVPVINKTALYKFANCDLSDDGTGASWTVGDCKSISIAKGLLTLGLNP